jgi:hypothetical protein
LGKQDDPNALVFGAYARIPLSGTSTESAAWTTIWTYQLAIDELNAAGGLPSADGLSHPLVAVVCDAGGSIDDSVDHLIGNLQVPAILAFLDPASLEHAITYASSLLDGGTRKTFWLNPGAYTSRFANLPAADDYLFHFSGALSDLAPAYGSLVKRVRQQLVRQPLPDAGIPAVRIAIVHGDDPKEPAFDLLDDLYNAVKQEQEISSSTPMEITLHADTVASNGLGVVVRQLLDYNPDLVISLIGSHFVTGDNEVNSGLIKSIEKPPYPDLGVHPYYILSPLDLTSPTSIDQLNNLLDLLLPVSANASRRFLGIGLAADSDSTLLNEYLKNLMDAHLNASPDRENLYDAVYHLAYAIYRATLWETPRVDGLQVRDGFIDTFTGTQPFDVGPKQFHGFDATVIGIPDVFAALHDGRIKLRGTMGLPSFTSPGSGPFRRKPDAKLYCYDPTPGSPWLIPQAQIYDGKSWSGDFCYTGFPP